jgi:hypothetical protein
VSQSPGEFKPSRRDILRPVEYVGGAAIAAIFVGVIALITTREFPLAIISAGGVFIVVLVVLALLAMAVKPDAEESAELGDPDAPKGPDAGPDAPPPAH